MIHHEAWFRSAVSTDLEEAVNALERAPSEPDLWVRYFHVAQRYNDFNAAKSLLPKASPRLIEALAARGFLTLSWKIGDKKNKSALEAADGTSNTTAQRIATLPNEVEVVAWDYDAKEVFQKFAKVTALTVIDKWDHPRKSVVEAFLRAENPTRAQADEARRIAFAARAAAASAAWWAAAAGRAAAVAWAAFHAARAGGPSEEESNSLLERMLVEGAPRP